MRRNRWLLFLLSVILAGLTGLTACGGGNSGGGGNGGGGGGGGTSTPTGVTIYPGANGAVVSVAAGATAQFTAYQADALVSVNWAATTGAITGNGTSSGTFTAPTTQGSVTISAVSTASSTVGGSVTVNVTAPAASGIVVSPGATMAQAGQVIAFTATENGAPLAATWEVNGAIGGDGVHGTIDGSGNYTPPLTPPPTGSTTITAIDPNNTANSGTASVAVVFSNSSFDGPYAFSYAGNDGNGFVTVAGSFTADGSTGSIAAGGEEDYVDSANDDQGDPFGGTFVVGPDGRGTLTISSTGPPDNGGVIQFALTNGQQGGPSQHAVLIRLDTTATGSGTMDAQNPLDIAAVPAGDYVFGVSGVDFSPNGNPINMAGKLQTDLFGNLTSGLSEQDFNYAGTNSSLDIDITPTGYFTMDANASTTGRGTLNITSTNTTFTNAVGANPAYLVYAVYIVDSKHMKLVETDNNFFLTSGDMYAQAGGVGPYTASNSLPSSNYAFTTGGTSNNGPFAAGGVFVSNGGTTQGGTSGGITGGVYDNNDAGATKLDLPLATTQSFGIGTLGRITLPIEPNTTAYNYVGYAGNYNSPNGQVNVVIMLDLEQNYVDSGLAYKQTAANTPSGNYVLNMTGVANTSQSEQDFEGQFGTGASGVLTGNIDINNAEVGNVDSNVPLTSSSITTVGADGRGTPLTLHTSSPTTSYPLAYYVIDDFTALVFETDNQRVLTGIIQKQN